MSYLDRLDSHMRDCCGVLSVEEQIRSGFRTKKEVNKTATILFREFGAKGRKKTKLEMKRDKKTGKVKIDPKTGKPEMEDCCCCSVEAIAKNLINPIRETPEGSRSITGRAFKNRSRGGLLAPTLTADAGVQYSDNGSILVSASDNSVLFSDAPSGLTGFSGMTMTDPLSGLGQGPNYSISTLDSDLEIESLSDDRSEDSLMEERAQIDRMNALGEADLLELYNQGVIDLNQLAEGIEQMAEGIAITEVLQLGMTSDNPLGYTYGRGGARAGAGRPNRDQVRIGVDEEMRPSEVRAVDRVVDRMLDDLEAEEDYDIED